MDYLAPCQSAPKDHRARSRSNHEQDATASTRYAARLRPKKLGTGSIVLPVSDAQRAATTSTSGRPFFFLSSNIPLGLPPPQKLRSHVAKAMATARGQAGHSSEEENLFLTNRPSDKLHDFLISDQWQQFIPGRLYGISDRESGAYFHMRSHLPDPSV